MSDAKNTFELLNTDGAARRGRITLPRGEINTPAFMPVGTAGTVKALYTDQVASTGAEIILGNTYHLMLRPGAEEVAALGGLHHFMNWNGPILTDSGGFQVMSLAKLREISEEGVSFQSHIDGKKYHLSPERSMEIQHLLGSNIQMIFDECTPYPCSKDEAKTSMELSLRWAERSKKAFRTREGDICFGIVQGSVHEDLRQISADELIKIGFDGYAIGGLAVGEGQEVMLSTLDYTTPMLPQDKPRYLMGVGTPKDLLLSVERGVDMFDCVMPTRSGRHGQAFTRHGKINLKNARFKADNAPLDETSLCPAARDYSKAYLHHLIKSGEYLGSMLLSWANIAYYQDLMAGMRTAIEAGQFEKFKQETLTGWAKEDGE